MMDNSCKIQKRKTKKKSGRKGNLADPKNSPSTSSHQDFNFPSLNSHRVNQDTCSSSDLTKDIDDVIEGRMGVANTDEDFHHQNDDIDTIRKERKHRVKSERRSGKKRKSGSQRKDKSDARSRKRSRNGSHGGKKNKGHRKRRNRDGVNDDNRNRERELDDAEHRRHNKSDAKVYTDDDDDDYNAKANDFRDQRFGYDKSSTLKDSTLIRDIPGEYRKRAGLLHTVSPTDFRLIGSKDEVWSREQIMARRRRILEKFGPSMRAHARSNRQGKMSSFENAQTHARTDNSANVDFDNSANQAASSRRRLDTPMIQTALPPASLSATSSLLPPLFARKFDVLNVGHHHDLSASYDAHARTGQQFRERASYNIAPPLLPPIVALRQERRD